MDCSNKQYSIREMRRKKRVQAEEGDNEEMTSMKGRIKPATEKECSEWLVKGKEGNESMGVGESESALYSLDCQFTSKPSLSAPPPLPPMSQTHLKCCCFGCRVPTKTHRQTEWV